MPHLFLLITEYSPQASPLPKATKKFGSALSMLPLLPLGCFWISRLPYFRRNKEKPWFSVQNILIHCVLFRSNEEPISLLPCNSSFLAKPISALGHFLCFPNQEGFLPKSPKVPLEVSRTWVNHSQRVPLFGPLSLKELCDYYTLLGNNSFLP